MMIKLDFIPHIREYTIISKIQAGYSGDNKYKLEKEGKFYLLRVGDKVTVDIKQKEFQHLRLFENTDVNTHQPIDFGVVGDKFYSIVTWVEGTPLMDVIKKDVTKDYYELGKKVGAVLRKLHQISCTDEKTDWYSVIKEKAEHILNVYRSMNIRIENRYAEEYILNNLELVKGRQNVLLHGDFHWENCVLDNDEQIGVIDFSGNNIGDPWYEFGNMMWVLEYSESFTNGQLDGYFDTIPIEFWRVFKLYTALYAFEHLSYDNGDDTESRIFNSTRMLRLFGDDFKEDIPLFRKNFKS
ncbi:MAG: aminoglycoside phosphotransferase [Anaerocolumna sp.]|nr:aminoglycoside phosphotransferase [Anaerocolumna sp.]